LLQTGMILSDSGFPHGSNKVQKKKKKTVEKKKRGC